MINSRFNYIINIEYGQFSCSSGNTNSTEKLSLFSKGLIKVLMVLAKFLKSFLKPCLSS